MQVNHYSKMAICPKERSPSSRRELPRAVYQQSPLRQNWRLHTHTLRWHSFDADRVSAELQQRGRTGPYGVQPTFLQELHVRTPQQRSFQGLHGVLGRYRHQGHELCLLSTGNPIRSRKYRDYNRSVHKSVQHPLRREQPQLLCKLQRLFLMVCDIGLSRSDRGMLLVRLAALEIDAACNVHSGFMVV